MSDLHEISDYAALKLIPFYEQQIVRTISVMRNESLWSLRSDESEASWCSCVVSVVQAVQREMKKSTVQIYIKQLEQPPLVQRFSCEVRPFFKRWRLFKHLERTV